MSAAWCFLFRSDFSMIGVCTVLHLLYGHIPHQNKAPRHGAHNDMLRFMLIEVIVAVIAIISVHPWVELRGLVKCEQID